jgi:hypothetical protein
MSGNTNQPQNKTTAAALNQDKIGYLISAYVNSKANSPPENIKVYSVEQF